MNDLKNEFNNVVDENKRLRAQLKEVVAEKLKPFGNLKSESVDKNVVKNLEDQLALINKVLFVFYILYSM